MIRSYQDLLVWQRAMELVEVVYSVTAILPAREAYGLISQLKRAAVSVPSNIAEGHARESTREYLRSIRTARGSLAEMETQLLLCQRLNLLTAENIAPALAKADELGKMIRGLQRSLNEKLNGNEQ